MKKIIVFGGSFNPPTIAHFALAQHMADREDVEKVLFLPVSDLYKKKELIPAHFREDMLWKVVRDNDQFELSLVEVTSDTLLDTVESMRLLKEEYPNNQLCFLLGADNLVALPLWNQGEQLLEEFCLYVIGREGLNISDFIQNNVLLNQHKSNLIYDNSFPELTISSTHVRDKIKRNESVRYLIPEDIVQYIEDFDLYREDFEMTYI